MTKVEEVARAINTFYARMWGSTLSWAVFDSREDWNCNPVRGPMRESEAIDLARRMNARAAIAAMKGPSEAMMTYGKRAFKDVDGLLVVAAFYGVTLPPSEDGQSILETAFDSMLHAALDEEAS